MAGGHRRRCPLPALARPHSLLTSKGGQRGRPGCSSSSRGSLRRVPRLQQAPRAGSMMAVRWSQLHHGRVAAASRRRPARLSQAQQRRGRSQQPGSARAAQQPRTASPALHLPPGKLHQPSQLAARQQGSRMRSQRHQRLRPRRPQPPSRRRRRRRRPAAARSSRACRGRPCWRACLTSRSGQQQPAAMRARGRRRRAAGRAGAGAARKTARKRRRQRPQPPSCRQPPPLQELVPPASSAASGPAGARKAAARVARRSTLASRSGRRAVRPVQRLLQAKRRLRVAATMRLSRLPWSQLRQSSQRLRLPQSQLPFQPALRRQPQKQLTPSHRQMPGCQLLLSPRWRPAQRLRRQHWHRCCSQMC